MKFNVFGAYSSSRCLSPCEQTMHKQYAPDESNAKQRPHSWASNCWSGNRCASASSGIALAHSFRFPSSHSLLINITPAREKQLWCKQQSTRLATGDSQGPYMLVSISEIVWEGIFECIPQLIVVVVLGILPSSKFANLHWNYGVALSRFFTALFFEKINFFLHYMTTLSYEIASFRNILVAPGVVRA